LNEKIAERFEMKMTRIDESPVADGVVDDDDAMSWEYAINHKINDLHRFVLQELHGIICNYTKHFATLVV